jgi:hypothetical protein
MGEAWVPARPRRPNDGGSGAVTPASGLAATPASSGLALRRWDRAAVLTTAVLAGRGCKRYVPVVPLDRTRIGHGVCHRLGARLSLRVLGVLPGRWRVRCATNIRRAQAAAFCAASSRRSAGVAGCGPGAVGRRGGARLIRGVPARVGRCCLAQRARASSVKASGSRCRGGHQDRVRNGRGQVLDEGVAYADHSAQRSRFSPHIGGSRTLSRRWSASAALLANCSVTCARKAATRRVSAARRVPGR